MDYKTKTIESYEKHAEYLADYFKGMLDLERRGEFQDFIDSIRGKKILDIGCGGEDHALYFKDKGFNVTCIDISKKMIEICKNKELNAFVMDMEDLKFDKKSFDGVWAVTSLLHLPKNKFKGVIEKLSSILKPGGIFFLCLKEGEGERFVVDKQDATTGRFFAFWKKDEVYSVVSEFFDLIKFRTTRVGSTDYLHFLLRKK